VTASPITPDSYLSAAAGRALLASSFPFEVVDDFIDLVERLPIVSKSHASKWGKRTKALADVGVTTTQYEIARVLVSARRGNSRRDFLRQFRDLKKRPTKRRLLNILERDKDENDLRPTENAIHCFILRLGILGDDVPQDWVERLSDSRDLLRKVAKEVCENFADDHGRPPDTPVQEYADRLARIYEALTGRSITYAKATERA
jgi:hypothetical protein